MEIDTNTFAKMRKRILKRKHQVARNQARFRDQEWDISEAEYFYLWESEPLAWLSSGTSSSDWNLSRKDMDGGWTLDNVHLVQRRDMLAAESRAVQLRKGHGKNKNN